jgi:hypothetical protein
MALETIFAGTYANDGTGDDLRSAFRKVNNNFEALAPAILDGENLGSGFSIFHGIDTETKTIQFNRIAAGNNVGLALVNGTLTISSGGLTLTSLEENLDLSGNSIVGTGTIDIEGSITTTGVIEAGDVQSTVWGIDIRNLYLLMLLVSGQDVDFGSLDVPTQGNLDLGSFIDPFGISYDFGTFLGSNGPTVIQQDFGTFNNPFPGGYDFGSFAFPLSGNNDAGIF